MTIKLTTPLAALALSTLLAAPSIAQDHASTEPVAERLKTLYPATRFGEIHPTPWPGVFEVAMGKQLAYVDASGQYFLFGHLFDMKTQLDLTAERKARLARIDFAQLPLTDALKEVRGNGSRVLAIFSDPDCPYCRKLEADIKPLTDVTIYTFLMPLTSIHPQARDKAIAVWCADDRTSAWRSLMHRGRSPATRECAHPVDRTLALAERLGISGTPTLIASDGRLLAGAVGLPQIEAWLDKPGAAR